MAIDDFGTGFSNLAYLQRLPATVLKIDKSFILSLESVDKDRRLVQTMIAMARDLEYQIVAEGIETRPTYELLVNWGCDEGQGFFMARPMTPEALLAAWTAAPSARPTRPVRALRPVARDRAG